MFIETSAKAGFNVKALFRKIGHALPGMDNPSEEQQKEHLTKVDLNDASAGNQDGASCAC
ncbi:hypothetical protein K501DRAFT_64078 [Backusella circina FSU 941]|nr:hypothetical protein K501DRAFT_64078 [Backusella circina FSU 941]